MSLEILLAQFDGLVQTPADVEKLNAAILQWAVQGRLVPQCPDDEPASTFLKQIHIENSKKLSPVSTKEKSHPIPFGWEWQRLGNIAFVGTGATPLRANPNYWEDGTIPWITSSATNSFFITEASEFVTELALSETNLTLYPKHTLIVAMYGQGKTRGQISELLIASTTNQACAAIVLNGMPGETRAYIKLFFRKNYDDLRSLAEGGAQPNLNLGKIKHICIPLPPLAEQKRIVARVDELLGQTAVLAQQLAAIQEQRRGLNTAVLHQLTTPPQSQPVPISDALKPPEISRDGVSHHTLFTNFDRLYVDGETIDDLKQAILQLAVQGGLVLQDPDDEPASILIKKIKTNKKELVKIGKMRKSKKLPKLTADKIPFHIPENWKWVQLGELALDVHYGYTASADQSLTDVRLLRITDIQDNRVNWSTVPGCVIKEKDVPKYLLEEKDILIARTGGTIGKTYIVEDISVKAVFASYLIRVIPPKDVSARYLKLFLESPLYWEQLLAESKGTGQPNVNATSLSQLTVPLPPLAEQKRIVAKVDELFVLCDQLAGEVTAAESSREQLLTAVLAQSV